MWSHTTKQIPYWELLTLTNFNAIKIQLSENKMFEVIVTKANGTIETYDALTEMQGECIFFRARSESDTDRVELNELIDD